MNDLFFMIPGCSCDAVPDQRCSFTLPGILDLTSFYGFSVAAATVEVGCFLQVKGQRFCGAVCRQARRFTGCLNNLRHRVCHAVRVRNIACAGALQMRL